MEKTNQEIVEQIKAEYVKLSEKYLYTFDDEATRCAVEESYQEYLDKLVREYPKECMRLVSENGGGDSLRCELDFGNGDKHIIKSKLLEYAYPLSDSYTVKACVIDVYVDGSGDNIDRD